MAEFKSIIDIAMDKIQATADEKDPQHVAPYMHLWDTAGSTQAIAQNYSQGKELLSHLELDREYNDSMSSPDWQATFMERMIQIINKYNLDINEDNVMELLSRYFMGRDAQLAAYKMWKKNQPIFEKSKQFVYKYGDCSKAPYVETMRKDIDHKGKNNVNYIIGDDQCVNCGYYDSGKKYCKLYNLKVRMNLVELLDEKEFKK